MRRAGMMLMAALIAFTSMSFASANTADARRYRHGGYLAAGIASVVIGGILISRAHRHHRRYSTYGYYDDGYSYGDYYPAYRPYYRPRYRHYRRSRVRAYRSYRPSRHRAYRSYRVRRNVHHHYGQRSLRRAGFGRHW